MDLQLTNLKNHQLQWSFSLEGVVPSPIETSQNQVYVSNGKDEEVASGEKNSVQDSMNFASDESDISMPSEVKEESFDQNGNDKNESLEHGLPDSFYASP